MAWVNDEETKRAYGTVDDACRVFRKTLQSGHPPDDWDRLLAEAWEESGRFRRVVATTSKGLKTPSVLR